MAGFPKDKAWALRQVEEQGGRPHRMAVMCLIVGQEAGGWRGMSRDQQVKALSPFVCEGEIIRWSDDGEAYIQPAGGARGAGNALSIDENRAAAAAAAHWANVGAKLERRSFQQAYAAATAHYGEKLVQLEEKVIDDALEGDASDARVRMGLALGRDWKDRHMGKAVAPTEDVTGSDKGSSVSDWIRSEPPSSLPLSAEWTVESVGQDQLKQLEAGELPVDGSDG